MLTHLLDSSFPTGGFVYSFGVESHAGFGVIDSEEAFRAFCLHAVRFQLVPFEYPFAKKAYNATLSNDADRLIRLDARKASYTYSGTREAQATLGGNLLKILPLKGAFIDELKEKKELDETLVLAAAGALLSIGFDVFVRLHCKRAVLSFGNAALKCSKLKVSSVHEAIFSIEPETEALLSDIPDSFTMFNPPFDMLQAKHKFLVPRMFRL